MPIDPWKEFGDQQIDAANVLQNEHKAGYRKMVNKLGAFGQRSKIMRPTSEVAVEHFDDGQLDFVYTNAMYHYEAVEKNISVLWPKINDGGLFSGHDYLDRVIRAGKYGVESSVDKFVAPEGLNHHMTRKPAWISWLVFK